MKEKSASLLPTSPDSLPLPLSLSLSTSPPPPRLTLSSPEQEFYLADATPFEERELMDVCSFIDDDDLVDIVKIMEPPKPFAGFGSYRQRHGDASYARRSCGGAGSRFSSEAPAQLGCGSIPRSVKSPTAGGKGASPSCPIDIAYECLGLVEGKSQSRLGKQHSFSSDIDREEAWERKRELYVMDELCSRGHQFAEGPNRTVARSVSDCGERTWPAGKPLLKTRTRSLTDEDLEELRGCIDLGFGFSSGEDCDLTSTLPALELYYAINRQYNDIKSRSSPVSPLDGASLYRTSSGESPCSPLSDSWRISSPGDNPSQVKTRLRHWAQAVACSVKQGFSL